MTLEGLAFFWKGGGFVGTAQGVWLLTVRFWL